MSMWGTFDQQPAQEFSNSDIAPPGDQMKGTVATSTKQHHRGQQDDYKVVNSMADEAAKGVAAASIAHTEADKTASQEHKPRIPSEATKKYYKILVVGESGLGKTTFIKNMFELYAQSELQLHDGSSTKLADFVANPGSMCCKLKPIPYDAFNLHISIQDTPGYGDDINLVGYLRRVVEHIEVQRVQDFDDNEGAIRAIKEPGCLEHSVTICLYFLPPHRTKRIDHILLAALSKVVATLPIIAKADSMVSDELEKYRKELQQHFMPRDNGSGCSDAEGILQGIRPDVYNFSDEHINALGLERSAVTPFAVIASTQVDRSDGQYKPYRKYKWGTADAVDRDHSDAIVLKRLLMGDTVHSIWDLLKRSIEDYKTVAQKLKDGRKLQDLIDEACRDTEVILEKDQQEKQQDQARDMAELHSSVKQLHSELNSAKADAEGLRSQLTNAKADAEGMRSQLDDAKADAEGLRSKLRDAETQAEGLRRQLRDAEAGAEDLRSQLQAKETSDPRLVQQDQVKIQSLEAQIRELQAETHKSLCGLF